MRSHLLPALLLLSTLCVSIGRGQTNSGPGERPRILFLKLKMHHGTVSLLRSTVCQGRIKIPRGAPVGSGIFYDVVSSKGEILLRDGLTDPSFKRFEYEDPAQPGQLVSRNVLLDDIEFTLRIPYVSGISRVEFYRVEEPDRNVTLPVLSRHPAGTVIPLSEGREQ